DRGRRVDVPCRLVGEKDLRTVDECPSNRHSLLFTTGEFAGHAVALAFEADQFDDLGDNLADEPTRLSDDLQRERHVLVDVLVGQQPEVLEYAADATPQVRNLPVRQP